jgi:hypothetical protein
VYPYKLFGVNILNLQGCIFVVDRDQRGPEEGEFSRNMLHVAAFRISHPLMSLFNWDLIPFKTTIKRRDV